MIFSVIGFSAFDIVYIAAVINYAAQSEMMIDLLNALKMLVERSFVDGNKITDAMTVHIFGCFSISATSFFHLVYTQDITDARKILKTLNGTSATATAFILFNLASNVVLCEAIMLV